MNITWDHPSLSPEMWNIFQGYEVYISRAGITQINVTQVNEPVNYVLIPGLEPLVTYEVSVAAYTLTGVGKKSEMQESLKPNMKELAWTITAALIARFTNKLITFRF